MKKKETIHSIGNDQQKKGINIMGYTHYFKGLRSDEYLADFAAQIVENADCEICGGMGEGEPEITASSIWLNGSEAKGEEFETFAITDHIGNDEFNFTKTGRMPYDDVVGAILIAAIISRADNYENIGSDGDIVDWSGPIELYEKTFGRLSDEEFADIYRQIGYFDAEANGYSDDNPPTRDEYENFRYN